MSSESDFDKAKGRVKEATGDLTDDKEMQREGEKDQAKGDAKEKVENVKDSANDMIDKAAGDDR